VESHVPETLERAFLIARVQQEVLDETKSKGHRSMFQNRTTEAAKPDTAKPTLKLGTGEFWKDRQLREYRRLNNLCFKCGAKYDPTHQCGQKPVAMVNAMEQEIGPIIMFEEVLNLMEMNDIAQAQHLSLSLNALSGSESNNCLRLRALVGNQVMLILVDSGSSNSFINENMLDRIQCEVQDAPPIPVKVANGQFMYTTKIVKEHLSYYVLSV
jgi:hypothetical protein